MNEPDVFSRFLDKLAREKSPEEVGKFIGNLLKFSSAEVYFTILGCLTEEDLSQLDKMKGQAEASAFLSKRFQERMNMTPEDFIQGIQTKIASGYLTRK